MEYLKISLEIIQIGILVYMSYTLSKLSLPGVTSEKDIPKKTIFNTPRGSFFVNEEKRAPVYVSEEKQWEIENADN